MKQTSFYRIYGWMRHAPYSLRGTTLEVYAALYDLTHKGEKIYTRAWLCEWLEMPNTSLGRAISTLQKKGLLSVSEFSNNTYAIQALTLCQNGTAELCQNGTELCQNGTESCQNGTELCQNGTELCQNGTEHLIYGDTNVSLNKKQNKKQRERADERGKINLPSRADDFSVEILESKKEGSEVISKDDVWSIAQGMRMSAEVAGAFYYYYAAREWRLSRGKPITRETLKDALMLWDIRQRAIESRRSGRGGECGDSAVRVRRGDVAPGSVMTMSEYYTRFGTTELQEGWHTENPTGEKMLYIRDDTP